MLKGKYAVFSLILGIIILGNCMNVYALNFNNTEIIKNTDRQNYSPSEGFKKPFALDNDGRVWKPVYEKNEHTVSGFHTENGKTYYYENGKSVTGWKKINQNGCDDWYYFEEDGRMATGFKKIAGKDYYFKNDGTLMYDCLQEIEGAIYKFSNSGAMELGWQSIDGKWYYFDHSNGQALTGKIDGIEGDTYKYFFWYDIFSTKNGSHEKEGSLAIGDPYVEIYTNNSLYYVADNGGHLLTNTEMDIDGVTYVFDADGRASKKNTDIVFRQKVNEIKEKFPVNAYWNHNGTNDPNAYNFDGSGTGNMFNNAWQCNGFAKYLYYYVYGETPDDLYDPIEVIPVSKVRIGDYLRIGNNEHSIFITDIYYDAEGRQHWNVAREVWGGSGNIIKECDYVVINETTVQCGGRMYTVDAIRRARNELRRSVGLADAEQL